MESKGVTLCFPDNKKTCFACCPPIRPAGYEHIQYTNIIKRLLRENSDNFDKKERSVVPITGFSCWGLGYIDKDRSLVGCMLHPRQNGGVDLRYRVEYGEKCRRELCLEAKIFNRLPVNEQRFWLHLTHGLESFSYSSREMNPLFNMMNWGRSLLKLIFLREQYEIFSRESFLYSYPFFKTKINPRANAYLINRLVNKNNLQILKDEPFRSAFERFTDDIRSLLLRERPMTREGPYVHQLGLDREFLDFIRLKISASKMTEESALRLKDMVDEELDGFYGHCEV